MRVRTHLGYWPHFVCGIPVNWLARNVICPVRGHKWRQTIKGFWFHEKMYGRSCRRCWKDEYCPCLYCVGTRKLYANLEAVHA
jgi:hypothetical protein